MFLCFFLLGCGLLAVVGQRVSSEASSTSVANPRRGRLMQQERLIIRIIINLCAIGGEYPPRNQEKRRVAPCFA